MNLSKNFTFNELTNTSHDSLLEKNRLEAKEYLDNLVALANDILEPLRDILKEPIYINSGFKFEVTESYVELLGQWGMLIMSFYFGGRTIEKVSQIVKGNNNDR